MKNIFIALFLLFAYNAQAQSWDAKLEDAQFQVRVNDYTAYTSTVFLSERFFTDDEFNRIQERCLPKEGIFKLELSPDKNIITVYLLNWIDEFTINWLFTEAVPDLENELNISPQEPYKF